MNTMLCRRLSVVAAVIRPQSRLKLLFIHPFHFRNVFSTEAHSQTLFSLFASTKLQLSEADITRIIKRVPSLKSLQTLHNVEQCIHTLNIHGFSEVQIAKMVRKEPRLLSSNAERILEPKIKLLKDLGFEGQTLTRLLITCPSILGPSIKNELLPKIEFLKNIFQPQDVLVKALSREPRLLTTSLEKTLKPSFAFWEQWGFCLTELYRFLQIYPAVLKCTSLTPAQADLIQKIGEDKGSKTFQCVLYVVSKSRLETLEAKIQNLKLCGLSAEETWQLFRVVPSVFCYSTENVSAKMNFVLNNMELPASFVVEHPHLLQISLEKVMRPRFLVWQKMKSMNGLGFPLWTLLMMREARFRKIVNAHPESKALWTMYENAIPNTSNHTKSSTKS